MNSMPLGSAEIHAVGRCHCTCHRGRAPRLIDHIEASLACNSCRLAHYEIAERERVGEFDAIGANGGNKRRTPLRFPAYTAGR